MLKIKIPKKLPTIKEVHFLNNREDIVLVWPPDREAAILAEIEKHKQAGNAVLRIKPLMFSLVELFSTKMVKAEVLLEVIRSGGIVVPAKDILP